MSGTRANADLVPYARAHADERAQNIDGEQRQIGRLGKELHHRRRGDIEHQTKRRAERRQQTIHSLTLGQKYRCQRNHYHHEQNYQLSAHPALPLLRLLVDRRSAIDASPAMLSRRGRLTTVLQHR
jgi:hypothetical protein